MEASSVTTAPRALSASDRHGKLTLLHRAAEGGRARWVCLCDCGVVKDIRAAAIKAGQKSCGCSRTLPDDLTNQRFGALTATKISAQTRQKSKVTWECVCDCGNIHTAVAGHLKSGLTRSCGCRMYGNTVSTHAASDSKAYSVWCNIKQRTSNANNPQYPNYGGRGIFMDPRWYAAFDLFLSDMGHPPAGLSLDRIDNDKGYFKNNCRWATVSVQSRNKRSNVWIDTSEGRMILSDFARSCGVSPSSVREHARKHGTKSAAIHFHNKQSD